MELLMKSELIVHRQEDKTGLASFKTCRRGFGFEEMRPPPDLQNVANSQKRETPELVSTALSRRRLSHLGHGFRRKALSL